MRGGGAEVGLRAVVRLERFGAWPLQDNTMVVIIVLIFFLLSFAAESVFSAPQRPIVIYVHYGIANIL